MTMDYDDYEYEDLGLNERGPRAFRVLTVQQYGNGDIDPFCRANLWKRAVRTRIADRDIEYAFGRGGDKAYLVLDTEDPETYRVEHETWVMGEEFTPKFKEKWGEQERLAYLQEQRIPLTDKSLLTDEQMRAILDNKDAEGLTRVVVKTKDGNQEKYYVEVLNHIGVTSSRFISASRDEYVLVCDIDPKEDPKDRDPNIETKKARPLFKPAQKVLETDEISEALTQELRYNFHMSSRLRLNRKLSRLHRLRREHPMQRVQYPFTGCSPKSNLDSNDQVSWRDATYRKAIQLKKKNKPSGKRQVHDLPPGLYYDSKKEEYQVRIGTMNIDGLRVLAHNQAERESRTAKEAYEQLMESLVHNAVRGNKEDRLSAWEILTRFGKNGLETGSRLLLEEIDREDKPGTPAALFRNPDERERARQRFTYEALLEAMKSALHAAYDIQTPLAGYDPFWTEIDHETRFGQIWYTTDRDDPNLVHMHKPWIKLCNDFIEANFDRSFPSEQHQFRRMLGRIWGSHDKKSYRSKAKALQRLEALSIHVISPPTVSWVYVPDDKGGGEWKLNIDWSTFDYFAEGIEAIRDWVRMINEWKFSKSAENSYSSMSFDQRTIDSLRGNDWGGIWNPVPYWACWSFWILYNYCKKRAPMPVQPVSPYGEPPKQMLGETRAEWQVRFDLWVNKYLTGRPAEPVRTIETDEEWNLVLQAYNQQAIDWMKQRDDQWIQDLKNYNQAIFARVIFMGWAWVDREPDDTMPHDGALRGLTAQKWADWLAGVSQIRLFNSLEGEGLVPGLEGFLKDQSSKVRNYKNETHTMESDEGSNYDPQAFWGYLGGILRKHVAGIINYRLQAFKDSPRFFEILFDITDVKNESATTIKDQLNKMWEEAPLKGLKRRIYRVWDDALAENVVHVRPRINKFLEGLPDGVIQRLQSFIRGMNRRSDYRVRLWAMHLASGIGGGKRAFTNAMRFLEEGYGTNTGMSKEHEQRLQDELGFVAWMNGQYDKAIWYVRAHTLSTELLVIPDAFHTGEEIIKLIASGLSVKVAWEIIEVIGEAGLIIKVKDTFPAKAAFLAEHHPNDMEAKYNEMLEQHLGKGELQAIMRGELFLRMSHKQERVA